jgi:hypothetical protein
MGCRTYITYIPQEEYIDTEPTRTPDINANRPFNNNGKLDIGYVVNVDLFHISRAEIEQRHNNVAKVLKERTWVIANLAWVRWGHKKDLKDWHRLPVERLPEYVVTFTKDKVLKALPLVNGYTLAPSRLWRPRGFCNEFPFLPRSRKTNYQAWIDYTFPIGKCGYNRAGTQHVSDTSMRWEASWPLHTPCIWNGRYWMGEDFKGDRLVDDLTRNTDIIIHELLHSFGSRGNADHFVTDTCESRLSRLGWTYQDSPEKYDHFGMCPDLLGNFVNSFKACK